MDLKFNCFVTILVFAVISVKAYDERTTIADWTYLYHSERLNWDDASSFCKNHGMNLITIDTPTQLKNAITIAKQNNLSTEAIWTSGTDLGHTDIFVWSSNGQLFDYVPWHEHEPNHSGSEECVTLVLWGTKMGLNNDVCSKKFEVICSMEN